MTPEMRRLLDDLKDGSAKFNIGGGPSVIPFPTYMPKVQQCQHKRMPVPDFDPVAAREMTSTAVRMRWPRKFMQCPDCSYGAISYASYEHYIAGDW